MKKMCTFVVLTWFRRNPKLFFHDKGSLTSLAATKVPLLVLDYVSRADGATLYIKHFLMLREKNFVTNSQRANVTPMPCFNAQEYHTQRLYNIIANFYTQYYVSDYNKHHNALLLNYLESKEAKQLPPKDLLRTVDLNNLTTEFLNSLKEAFTNFKKFNVIKTDQL